MRPTMDLGCRQVGAQPVTCNEKRNRLRRKPDKERHMKLNGMILAAVAAGLAVAAGAQDAAKVTLKIDLPKPQFTGTPKDIRSPNLEPARYGGNL